MEIDFQTVTWEVDTLKNDLDYLEKTLGFPCEFEKTVNPCKDPRSPDSVAIAFFGPKEVQTGVPIIEINTEYFKEKQDDRILILLHEIIHCCQRIKELKSLNEKFMIALTNRINSIIDEVLKTQEWDLKFNIFRSSSMAVALFSSWIFEIWDEMLLLKKYSKIFEQKLELTFERINQDIDEHTFEDYGAWAKYPVFINLVRAYYLKKITEKYDVSKKYEDLYERWRKKLESITDNEEYEELMNQLEDLIRIEDYESSDTSTMEKAYDKMIDKMIDDARENLET